MYNVKDINIKNFLAEQGVLPKQERTGYGMYVSPFRSETAPSFKVDYNKNLWYDFGSGEGGSIIDLVMKLDGCTINEAIAKLENGSNFSFHRSESTEPVQSTMQIVSVKPLQNHHLINYLQSKRSINLDIAREYCREVHYTTNGKPFFAIGFQSDAGGWELRNEYFKGSTSPKSPTTIGSSSPTCLLIEGFMDMLSYLTLKNAIRPTVDMAVLNSVHNLHRAEEFLKQHQTIHCFLDNDESGRRAFAAVERLGRETIDQSPFYRNHKDLNEYIVAHRLKSALEPIKESMRTPIHKSNNRPTSKSRNI
ncbi:DNA primase [Mucinivorans hirudinis]|uniref:DNA primase n=1 Tax=Mucinivorans hirudinis TaxID=1433126 RepID=A0A060RED7_9BACT|nr:DNA primase [Mucinivorans hirudinis]